MLRLIKHEYRKNMVFYIILFSLALATGLLSVFALWSENDVLNAFAIFIVVEAVPLIMLFFFITNIITYSKELNSRAGYLAFMTPCSAFEIAGSKFLTMIINATITMGLFVGFFAIDYQMMINMWGYELTWDDITLILRIISILFGTDIPLYSLAAFVTLMFFAVFAYMCMLFFAITLSRTLLENRGGRVPLAMLFFVVLAVGTTIALWNIPYFYYGDHYITSLLGMWPAIMLLIAEIAGSYVGASLFLEKKLSV